MNETTGEAEARLAEARSSLREMLAAIARTHRARLFGTLAAVAIGALFAVVFVREAMTGLNLRALADAVEQQARGNKVLVQNAEVQAKQLYSEVAPVYLAEVRRSARSAGLEPVLTKQASLLLDDVGGELLASARTELDNLDLMPVVERELSLMYTALMRSLTAEVQVRARELGMESVLEAELSLLAADVSSALVKEFKARADELDMTPAIMDEVARLLADIGPSVASAVKARTDQLEVTPVLEQEIARLAARIVPVAAQEMVSRFADAGLLEAFADEFILLAQEVGPAYMSSASEMADDLGLMETFAEGMRDVAAQVGPAYRAHLKRVAPDIAAAAEAELADLSVEVMTVMEARLKQELRESLAENEQYIRESTGLTPEVAEDKLAGVVVAAESALTEVVRARTDRYQADLDEIAELLSEVPDSQNKDPKWLVNEMGKVSLELLKARLPTYKSELEWPGAGQ